MSCCSKIPKRKFLIGKGSFGKVYYLNDQTVVKMVCNCSINDEIYMLSTLSHPNIVKLINSYSEKTYFCLILEYIPYTLKNFIEKRNIHFNIVRKLFKQALSALEYLDSCKIAHRDIKPSNILVDTSYTLKICDFGSATIIRPKNIYSCYVTTRFYRAPELVFRKENYSTLIDIWSLGTTFVEFFYPTHLFSGINNSEMAYKILTRLDVSKSTRNWFNVFLDVKNGPGIRVLLKNYVTDHELLEVFENSIVADPSFRMTATELLNLDFFKE